MKNAGQDTIKSVAIAMSGGVDSSVAAALLREQGYHVFGVTMQLWNEDPLRAQHTIDSSRKVCDFLGIPFHVLDLTTQFHHLVVEYFLKSQLAGRTPNPCFVCNQAVKWGLMLEESLKLGADLVATGHYARVQVTDGYFQLYKGVDPRKDQSYVLAGLNQAQLARAILPLGDMSKDQVRKIARSYNLPVAVDTESQDLCFLGGVAQDRFLSKYLSENIRTGKLYSMDGELVGEHEGLVHYTIGQRKGLGSGNAAPIFVLKKEVETDSLIVGTKDQLGNKLARIRRLNWISGEIPVFPLRCSLKIRYKATPVYGKIDVDENQNFYVRFDTNVRDATPGQFIVFYDGERVLGSAEIEQVLREEK